jgi:amino acid transporter
MTSVDTRHSTAEPDGTERDPQLIRGIGLGGATMLNMIDMIGVGPFITLPLIIAAMAGPQAILGWIFGAALVMCDGLVWAELGAAMPGSGGSYRYLNEIYGRGRLGRLMSFLFVWQLTFSAPLSIASGCIGFAMYAVYAFPVLDHTIAARDLPAVPQDHGHRKADPLPVGRRHADAPLGHRLRRLVLRPRAGLRLPFGRLHAEAGVLHRPGGGAPHRRL